MSAWNNQPSIDTPVEIDGGPLSLNQVRQASVGRRQVSVADEKALSARVEAAADFVRQAAASGEAVYGVTTGFGGMVMEKIPADQLKDSQANLLAFLATGAGAPIARRHTRGAMLLRANVLLRGHSGIRMALIQRLVRFLQADAIPVVRKLGSIGASGDLVPLATIARAITGGGDRIGRGRVQVLWGQETLEGKQVLSRLDLQPLELEPKEALALVNGTSFSAAIAANAACESKYLLGLTLVVQAMMARALLARSAPFEPFVHQCKPHPGQVWVAEQVLRLLPNEQAETERSPGFVQDRYSLRCLPQYLGPVVEGLARVQQVVETEMNAVSDNPLVDVSGQRFYQSGNFLGQYVAIAMDDLRRFIGLMAKHLDVQIAMLVAPEFSGGLSPSLRGNDALKYNMGLKGLQLTGNSIMPILTYMGNPLVEHFPTHAEQFNQNVNGLSWGASNMAWESVEMFRQYLSISLIFAIQALDLRARQLTGHFDGRVLLGSESIAVYEAVHRVLQHETTSNRPFVFDDTERWLEQDIATLATDLDMHGEILPAISPVVASMDERFGLVQ